MSDTDFETVLAGIVDRSIPPNEAEVALARIKARLAEVETDKAYIENQYNQLPNTDPRKLRDRLAEVEKERDNLRALVSRYVDDAEIVEARLALLENVAEAAQVVLNHGTRERLYKALRVLDA